MALVTLTAPNGAEVRVLPAAVEALTVENWPTPNDNKTRILLSSGATLVVSGSVADTATALGL